MLECPMKLVEDFMKVVPVPCLRDNFAYLIICESTRQAGIVDPGEGRPILAEIERQGVQLTAILNTHHHPDHVGGNREILAHWPAIQVYAHASDKGRIPGQNVYLEEGHPLAIGHLNGRITHNPGHTTGAITYYFLDAAFTGDTLFGAGCGRTFEGTAAEMHHSLNHVIGSHDPSLKLYFGHEYTESNLAFALHLEPGNQAIRNRLSTVHHMRSTGKFTTPSTLLEEYATNPFMRCDAPQILEAVKAAEPDNDLSPAEVFRVIRAMKDNF